MRVYHFLNKEFGLKDLVEKRLKIATIMELNDPFEFLGVNLSNRDLRKRVESVKKTLSKEEGVLCFSQEYYNPVQWAHYADNHKGICLGFDIPDDILCKVQYIKQRISFPNIVNFDKKVMKELLLKKYVHWKYEKEYRLYVKLQNKEVNGLYYCNFSDTMILKEVIVGYNSDITPNELDMAIGNIKKNIKIIKARPAFSAFKIVKNMNNSLWK